MTLIELPRRRDAPRTFVEPPAGLERRVTRALDALGDLPEGFDLPGLPDLAEALIAIADELQGDVDREDEEDRGEDEALPLFAFAARAGP
jgi:predicted RNA polymerase sigma factor